MPRTCGMLVIAAILLAAPRMEAQVTESPIAFDSAGRVRTLTPPLVARLGLKTPEWPVEGDFREARLYALSSGGRVLAVERPSGSVDRFTLSDEAAAALQTAVDAALTLTGRMVTEERSDVVSEPARRAFTRGQMFATWTVYGPAVSYIANEGALYLLATGASYFITNGIANREQVTRAQSHLAFDGAYRGYALGSGALYAVAGRAPSARTYAGVGLLSALGTATAGFRSGRKLTDGEAEARTTISTLSAATTFTLLGTARVYETESTARGATGAIVGAGMLGYAFGPRYARQPGYAVTKGDVQVLGLSSTLGVMAALTPLTGANTTAPEVVFSAATLGLGAGALIGHKRLVRRYDYSAGDASQVRLGALAGLVLGEGVAALGDVSSTQAVFALLTGGAILGAVAGHNMADPARSNASHGGDGAARRYGTGPGDPRSLRTAGDRRPSVEFEPQALAMIFARTPGHHLALRVRF